MVDLRVQGSKESASEAMSPTQKEWLTFIDGAGADGELVGRYRARSGSIRHGVPAQTAMALLRLEYVEMDNDLWKKSTPGALAGYKVYVTIEGRAALREHKR